MDGKGLQPGSTDYIDAVNNLIAAALGVAGNLMRMMESTDDFMQQNSYVVLIDALANAVGPFAHGPICNESSFQ